MARSSRVRFDVGRGGLIHVGVLDDLTPTLAQWLTDWSPAAQRALRRFGRLVRTSANANLNAMLGRSGRNRTSHKGGRGAVFSVRQIAGQGGSLWIWPPSGILAAHELGATIPGGEIRPTRRQVLAWGGPPGGPHTHFAPVVRRAARTLRRRPWLSRAYATHQAALPAILEAEYQQALNAGPGGPSATP